MLSRHGPGPTASVAAPGTESAPAHSTPSSKDAVVGAPGQVVGDVVCGSRDFWAVFRNGAASCEPGCGMIGDPGPAADCSTPFAPPILADLDGDGEASCDARCRVDLDDVARACGVTLPFPACAPQRRVVVTVDADCPEGDREPGNHRCDLAAGTYGAIAVQDGARVAFAPGTTVACSLTVGKGARATSSGPATILVPGRGAVRLRNLAEVGTTCGMLTVVAEHGGISFGRNATLTLDACTLGGRLTLGHANELRGHFIGDTVGSDRNNLGRCCGGGFGPPTTTSTTTSSTSTTATSSSTTSSPATAAPPSTTSTSSTTSSSTTTTTSSTLPAVGGWTRSAGFYKTHPTITAAILRDAAVTVCGRPLVGVAVDHARSAIEALCNASGDARLRLVRQLTTAALTQAAGGAAFPAFAACDALCRSESAAGWQLAGCIEAAEVFNASGDALAAPFDPPGRANPVPCAAALSTACTVLSPSRCAAP